MAQLNILERQIGGTTILDLSGDITFGEGNLMLRRAIRSALSKNKKKITLNLGNVCYLDSSGIGELISGLVATNRVGGQLTLINMTPRIEELLCICKLSPIFDVCKNEVEAVGA